LTFVEITIPTLPNIGEGAGDPPEQAVARAQSRGSLALAELFAPLTRHFRGGLNSAAPLDFARGRLYGAWLHRGSWGMGYTKPGRATSGLAQRAGALGERSNREEKLL